MKKQALMIILLATVLGLCFFVTQASAFPHPPGVRVVVGFPAPPPPPFPFMVAPPGVYVAPGPSYYDPYYDDPPRRWRHRRHHWRDRHHRHRHHRHHRH